ncbi:uncharacterized protein K02A2.6-like [Wyeomyia smithii]|uniref:uncharacterized protein K02A2.6-like n=1 Tax=Wyeomyia smithii TaxID=174621 RepID=UPI002467CEE5|nr:uncharacterized protein K02A2.6-like [Wyeomyia smithii]
MIDRNNRKCCNCNRVGHIAKDISKCVARNVTCFNCGNKGHFKVCCRKRKAEEPSLRNENKKRVYAVIESNDDKAGSGVFFVNDNGPSEILKFIVGDVPISLVVDSGSPANIIRDSTYQILQRSGAKIVNERKADRTLSLEAFASNEKIQFSMAFEAEIRTPEEENRIWAHFLVAPKGQTDLLSKATAFALGVLRIGYSVNMITGTSNTKNTETEFPKIPGVSLKIHIDESVRPAIQAPRRLPIAMEAAVEEIRDLIDKKIIERVEGPQSWVSPIVPVRKSDGKIRVCIDMRVANQAVIREHYPMPNIDSAMASIPKVAKLSKVDLESAYYHLELEPDSRKITTFACRSGVYRFRRLMFGIKSAPELFQREMENLFRGIDGLIVFLHDALIHGSTEKEHDERLDEFMKRAEANNLKINKAKSVFGVKEAIFLGHVVSVHGIRPTNDKIQAILDLQPPSFMTELKSLMGTINFVGKFIPNLASMTACMGELLIKDTPFLWRDKHDQEHIEIKATLGKVESLGFFNPVDETLLITDASPVGVGAIMITSIPDSPNPIIRRFPTQPWQDLAMDFKEGLPLGKSLLVVVCYTSRFIQVEAMKPATTQKVISALLRMFALFGVPRSITADNGPQFRSSELKQFCTSYGIHLNLSTPYWPEQNGAVERQMRNIGRRIKISTIQGTDWEHDLMSYLLMYHATPQETTGVAPSKMMLGRELLTTMPSINKCNNLELEPMRDRDMMLKEKNKARSDERRHATSHQLKEGDTVIMRNQQTGSLQPTFTAEEFNVAEVNGSKITVRSKQSGKTYFRNSAHLKKLQTSEEDVTEEDNGKQENSDNDMVTDREIIASDKDRVSDPIIEELDRYRRKVKKPERFRDFVLGKP